MSAPLFNFSPRFPWSGDVIQDIEPRTNWFFGAIAPEAGTGRLEQHIALDVASYGKQLSAILDLLHAMLAAGAGRDLPRAVIDTFESLYARIESAKANSRDNLRAAAERSLDRLREADEDAYRRLLAARASATG